MENSIQETSSVNKLAHSQRLGALEKAMAQFEQVELEVRHHFAHGTYTRELFLPEGTIATGKIHRFSCTNILSKGRIRVVTSEGTKEIEAPCVFKSGPGEKKAVVALEDCIFINVHPWNGTDDLEALESQLIVPSTEMLEHEFKEQVSCHGHLQQ